MVRDSRSYWRTGNAKLNETQEIEMKKLNEDYVHGGKTWHEQAGHIKAEILISYLPVR